MRFAYQTVLWGVRPTSFQAVFASIAKNGFGGVEIAQAPAFLPRPAELRDLLQAYGLELLALSGGKLEDRLAYSEEGGLKPSYYYLTWLDDHALALAAKHGCRLALHPHVYTELINPEKTREQLDLHKDILYLPDTAHLHMAQVDVPKAIEPYLDRLAAIHLKDWSAVYGLSCQRYARAFTQLGQGEVHPERVLSFLKKKDYRGWVVVECDTAKGRPEDYVEGSRVWLQAQGFELRPAAPPPAPDTLPEGRPVWLEEALDENGEEPCALGHTGCLYRELFQHLRKDSLEAFAESALEATVALIPGTVHAQIWEHSPTNRLLGLLAEYPKPATKPEHFLLDVGASIYGESIMSKTVGRFDPKALRADRNLVLDDPQAAKTCGQVITVPVFNSCNSNQVQLVLAFCVEKPDPEISDGRLLDYADVIAIAYETVLDELSLTASCTVEQRLSRHLRYDDFIRAAVNEIRTLMRCDGVSMFLVGTAGQRVRCAATTGIRWMVEPSRQFYERGDGSQLVRVWETDKPLILHGQPDETPPKSEETVSKPKERLSLFFPMRDAQGKVIGVLRCRNRTKGRHMFSETDLALVESICQTIVPNLLTLQESARRARTIDRMIHELKMPLTAIRGAADVLAQEAQRRSIQFAHDYVGDIASWLDLLQQQIRNVDFYRYRIGGREDLLRPVRKRVMMLRDVVAPARRHIKSMLDERGFPADRIKDDGFYHLPALYLDRAMFQQVFFNLLGNAIKYCYSDPKSFSVYMWTERDAHDYLIHFEDRGMGIPKGYESVIFEPYVRGPGMERYNVSGDGLGLWVVRQIVEAHGGRVEVTSPSQPTRITISLPNGLSSPDFRVGGD